MTNSSNSNSNSEVRQLIERAREMTWENFDYDIVDDLADALQAAQARIDELEAENKQNYESLVNQLGDKTRLVERLQARIDELEELNAILEKQERRFRELYTAEMVKYADED